MDFLKAFDKVPHARLVKKLDYYGILGKTLQWITSFLHNRSQQVVIEGTYSSPCKVTSGVLQGTVLGPTLFLLYINDLKSNIQSTVHLFANDCLIYRPINSPNDHQLLQQDLNTLNTWAKTNLMLTSVAFSSYPNTTIKQHFFIICQTNPSKLLNSILTLE